MCRKHLAWATVLGVALLATQAGSAAGEDARHAVRGMVMKVASSRKSLVVSHDRIPGLMEAMTMSFDVGEASELAGIEPGMTVEFTLVVGRESARAEQVQIRRYETVEQDPLTARRLKLLKDLAGPPRSGAKPLAVGQAVPDFTLTDQAQRPVTLSALRGRLVAVNFVYTNCTQPQFCLRTANNFGALQKRFGDRLGRDLVLLTVTFDPVRDGPERLAQYATQWASPSKGWRFLTGAVPDIQRVCDMFGVDFFPDEGLISHSSRTALIDRRGYLVTNIEGNQFTASQLGDLIDAVLSR